MFRMAILGAGNIAGTMAETIREMPQVESYAVAARDGNRAEAFAREYGFTKYYASYEEMAADDAIDLVYIATPHSHHFVHAKLCLEHGRNVLCEKAFTVNALQAEELFRLAKEKNVLLTEAIWPRYMPSRQMIDEAVASGMIGEVTSLTANLGYVLDHVKRMQDPALAGGALLDLGVYPLNFAAMVFGNRVKSITAAAVMSEAGVDYSNSITLVYEDGKMAVLHSNMLALTDRRGVIAGSKGYIEIQNINNCEAIQVYDLERTLIKEYEIPKQITGYEYEVEACRQAIKEGRLECPQMPHAETLRIMRQMDTIRQALGITYPCE